MNNSLEIATGVQKVIVNSESTDDLSDIFCFVVGFLSSELKERLSKSPETSEGESLSLQLEAVEAAWERYKERLSDATIQARDAAV